MTNRTKLQEENENLTETLDTVSELAEEALDPELTREELVGKVNEIAEAVGPEEEEPDESGE